MPDKEDKAVLATEGNILATYSTVAIRQNAEGESANV